MRICFIDFPPLFGCTDLQQLDQWLQRGSNIVVGGATEGVSASQQPRKGDQSSADVSGSAAPAGSGSPAGSEK
jgi:hypothetical protein